ncbi:DEKNAAC102107 [Brettanomyces naardenensis]|uniref:DEKNAAC102107 n=1 Tax=Brettanomyces naardenensis TaxID=13370 RepID=A0A448YJR9_BRENA|nr:DEKNAAC102107 [Brettanomyces naardenensis]
MHTPKSALNSTAFLPESYFVNGTSGGSSSIAMNDPLTPPDLVVFDPQQHSRESSFSGSGLWGNNNNTVTASPVDADLFYSSRRHTKSRSVVSFEEDHQRRKRLFSYPQSQAEELQNRQIPAQTRQRHKSVPSDASIMSSLEAKFGRLNVSTTPQAPSPSISSATDVLSLSKDQYGCRFLQKKIDEDFQSNFPPIFQAVYQHSAELMMDPFGNYLIQKLMISATPEEFSLILLNVGSSLYSISINQHGTRACQKMIDCLSTPAHHRLLETYLSPHIVGLIQDLNGNHVIQKCIQKFQDADLQFIVDLICQNMVAISTHKHGCCVLQKLMNKCNSFQVTQLGMQIINNSIVLMQDQFGNYVVQYLISLETPELNNRLIAIVAPYVSELSCQKFSSNVVEKCLKIKVYKNNARKVNPLLDELLRESVLTALIKDQYGNYVVQTAMEVSPFNYKVKFASTLNPLLPMIRFTTFGKRIHNKVAGILEEAERNADFSGRSPAVSGISDNFEGANIFPAAPRS